MTIKFVGPTDPVGLVGPVAPVGPVSPVGPVYLKDASSIQGYAIFRCLAVVE